MKIRSLLLCASLFLTACGLESYPGGDLPTATRLNTIKTGDTKDKVLRVLGTPASSSVPLPQKESFLVYAQNLKTSRAFLDPKEVKRDVYVYYFNNKDILTEIQHKTLDDARTISYDTSETTVTGHDLSIWEQIIQNFGRYNTGAGDSSIRR